MKRPLLITFICLLIISFCNTCKNNSDEKQDKKNTQALSLLAFSNSTCDPQISISPYLNAAIAKYNDCTNDSDCVRYSGGFPSWGQKCNLDCYFSCGSPYINSTRQSALAAELNTINETYCKSAFNLSMNCESVQCNASCVNPDYIINKCKNKKCSFEVLPF